MKKRIFATALVLLLLTPGTVGSSEAPWPPEQPEPEIVHFAGNGWAPPAIVDGSLTEAVFHAPMGIVSDEKGVLWVWDTVSLRRIADGKVETVASLWDLEEELRPYKLDSTQAIMSFNLATIDTYKDTVYISGMMFRQDRRLDPDSVAPNKCSYCRFWYMGDVYNVLLKYQDGKLSIVDLSWARSQGYDERWRYDFDERGKALNGSLYAYHWMTLWPRFSINDDGTIYMVRRRDEWDDDPFHRASEPTNLNFHEIVRIRDGKVEPILRESAYSVSGSATDWNNPYVLSSIKGWKNHYAVVSPDEKTAIVYTGERGRVYKVDLTGNPVYNKSYHPEIPKEVIGTGTAAALHPRKFNGALYFLDETGIWRPMTDHTWLDRVLDTDKIQEGWQHIKVPDWAITPDGTVYLISYETSTIVKIDNFSLANDSDIWRILVAPDIETPARPPVQQIDGEVYIPLAPLSELFTFKVEKQGGKQYIMTNFGRRIPIETRTINNYDYMKLSEVQRIWSQQMWPPYKVDWDDTGKALLFSPITEGLPQTP